MWWLKMLMKHAHGLARWWRDDSLSVVRSSVASLAVKVVGLVLVMAVAVVLARQMGAAEYGRLAFIQSVVFVLSAASTLGFRDSANKMVARYAARKQSVLLSRFIVFGVAVIALSSIASAAIGHSVIAQMPGLSAKYDFPILAVVGMVVTLTLLSFLAPTLVALGEPVLSFALENIGPRVIVLASALIFAASGAALTATSALCLNIIGNLAPLIALAVIIIARFDLRIRLPRRFSTATKSSAAWLSISLFMMTSPIISLVFSETSILVLGAYAAPGDVALYQVGRRLSELATVCGGVAIYVALPSFAKFHALRRVDQLQHTVNIANVLTVIPGICFLLVLLAGGDRILSLFGPAFAGAYAATLILSSGRVADQLFGPVLEVLLMTGHHSIASFVNIAFAFANILANCVLVPLYGQAGAAVATVVVTLLWKASLYGILRRRSSIETCVLLALVMQINKWTASRGLVS
jgi:O-antigen/teichoic acid export membrane protein